MALWLTAPDSTMMLNDFYSALGLA